MSRVSVIIPAFNSARHLPEAVQSVLHQTFTDFELWIVDDGSTDDTQDVIAEFEADPRVHIIHQVNAGAAAARNSGIRQSQSEYVAFLDADDWWHPDKLRAQVEFLESHPDCAAVHTAITLVQFGKDGIERTQRIQRRSAFREQTLYEELLYRMVITGSASSVMVRREVLDEVGPFDETLRISDRDMWQRLAEQHHIGYVDSPLVSIRKHSSNMSGNRLMIFENHARYFQKLTHEIPDQYRFHLPRVAISRFSKWTAVLIRYGNWRAAGIAAWTALTQAFRHPGALFHVASDVFRMKRGS